MLRTVQRLRNLGERERRTEITEVGPVLVVVAADQVETTAIGAESIVEAAATNHITAIRSARVAVVTLIVEVAEIVPVLIEVVAWRSHRTSFLEQDAACLRLLRTRHK